MRLKPITPEQCCISSCCHLVSLESPEENSPSHLGILKQRLREFGFDTDISAPGQFNNLLCPKCKGGDTKEKSLSLFIKPDWSFAMWKCFRKKCYWKGYARASDGTRSSHDTSNKITSVKLTRVDGVRIREHHIHGRAIASEPCAITPKALFSSIIKRDCGVFMVQGASRGIGLEFAKQMLEKNDNAHVIATCRDPSSAMELCGLKNKFDKRLSILRLDVTDENTIEHMWHLLIIGGGTGTERDVEAVANLSSRVGSIGNNRLGDWISYRASKSSLTQLTKNISVEFARKKDPITCILLHPSTVDTDLSKPFQRNISKDKLLTKEFSVQKLLLVINSVTITDNGKFFAWDGQEIPW